MKKIIILNWRDPKHPNAGGAEQATLKHALAWQKSGHEITWFSSSVDGLAKREKYKNINIVRHGYFVFGVQLAAFIHLQKNKYDLVVDQIHGLPFFTPLYLNNKKILAYIHEVTREVVWHNPYPFPLNKIIGLAAYILEPIIFYLFYRNISFMTVSDSTKQELENWGIKNIEVIQNGVTVPSNIKIYPKNKQKTLIYLGAIARDKGIFDAIEIFNQLAQKHPRWKFWVVGKGDANIMEEIKLKSNKRIKFWGFVNDRKKFELLSKAHLLVNPSIREGWGLVNIEANAVGTPVVGYDVAGMRDSVKDGETGILVKLRDNNTLIKLTEDLLNNNKKYKKLSQNAYKYSEKFDWTSAGQYSLSLVESMGE